LAVLCVDATPNRTAAVEVVPDRTSGITRPTQTTTRTNGNLFTEHLLDGWYGDRRAMRGGRVE
jgi:hypothetical protein